MAPHISIHYIQSEIFQAFIVINLDDYGLHLMKTQNAVSQKTYMYVSYQGLTTVLWPQAT